MDEELVKILKAGGVAVAPTDTLYGLLARANDEAAVRRIYEIKQRQSAKKLIILIARLEDLAEFGVVLTPELKTRVEKYWPGPVSLILPVAGGEPLAFRLPTDEALLSILRATGPLVAPSANPEGAPPAETVAEAQSYFSEQVGYYLDGGRRAGGASQLIDLTGAVDKILRP